MAANHRGAEPVNDAGDARSEGACEVRCRSTIVPQIARYPTPARYRALCMVASIMKDGHGIRLFTGSHLALCSQELIKPPEHLDPIPKLLQIKLFVGGMEAIVGKPDAGENHGC